MRKCKKCNASIEDEMMFCPECGLRYIIYDTNTYASPNCPIIIAEQTLFIDDDNASVSIILGNISEKCISACAIRIKCNDQFGDELSDNIVKYIDLSAENGETFGEEKTFVLNDSDTRIFQVIAEKILFDDGTLWIGNAEVFTKTDAYGNWQETIENNIANEIEDLISKRSFYEDKIKEIDIEIEKHNKTIREYYRIMTINDTNVKRHNDSLEKCLLLWGNNSFIKSKEKAALRDELRQAEIKRDEDEKIYNAKIELLDNEILKLTSEKNTIENFIDEISNDLEKINN